MIFDVCIIGLGVSGAFSALRLSEKDKKLNVLGIDLGRPPAKRRRQTDGWLGCLPNSDGKLYANDIDNVTSLVGKRNANKGQNYFLSTLSQITKLKLVKDRSPQISTLKKINKAGYELTLNDYYQIFPNDVHALSKYIVTQLDENSNLKLSFDNEVFSIDKINDEFIIKTEEGDFKSKKIIVSVGRSGWRWVNKIFKKFNIKVDNNIAKFGLKLETDYNNMKDYNKSNCYMTKDNIEVGPLQSFGTVIPEDNNSELVISAFRSNENRWKTNKVTFNVIGNINFENEGCEQTDRIAKLSLILANDRILKERVTTFLNDKSKMSIIKEYSFLKDTLNELDQFLPIKQSYLHVPTIITHTPKANISKDLETDVEGLYLAGESANINGILAAGIMGVIAADSILK